VNNININELKKLYYTMGEVSDMFNVNSSLIRFWEKEFDTINPKKNKKGNRLFTVKDIEEFNKIYQLVKIQGFTLEGAKTALKEQKKQNLISNQSQKFDSTIQTVISKLEGIKNQLLALKK
jgi:DNA-binding transcriptional MerR regulator